MDCSPFLRGFLPGILIGVFSSFLLFSLWKNPSLARQGERELQRVAIHLGISSPLEQHSGRGQRREAQIQRRKERQAIREHESDPCNASHWLHTQPLTSDPSLLLVLVHSTPRATEQRNAIRATWLTENNRHSQYEARFVIGTAGLKPKDIRQLTCENKEHKDLLLLPEIDDLLKTVEWSPSEKLVESFQWALDNTQSPYIFKCSDTTFAILDPILKELESRNELMDHDLLWGFFAGGVQATKEGRLAEEDWFLCSHYLPYPQGGGYVISRGLVSMVIAMKEDLQHYTHDDIALGVWLSPFNRIEKRHDVRFNTGLYSRGCNNAYIVTHKETASSMHQKFSQLRETGQICEEEFLSRLSYNYNWTAPANRCCVRKPGVP